MLEKDYLALSRHVIPAKAGIQKNTTFPIQQSVATTMSSAVIKELVIPALEKEVNEGKNSRLCARCTTP